MRCIAIMQQNSLLNLVEVRDADEEVQARAEAQRQIVGWEAYFQDNSVEVAVIDASKCAPQRAWRMLPG